MHFDATEVKVGKTKKLFAIFIMQNKHCLHENPAGERLRCISVAMENLIEKSLAELHVIKRATRRCFFCIC